MSGDPSSESTPKISRGQDGPVATLGRVASPPARPRGFHESLPEVYGYVEHSHVNTLGLLRRVVSCLAPLRPLSVSAPRINTCLP